MREKISDVIIEEYHNGELRHTWYGLKECASYHHTHINIIKALIYTGNPLPTAGESITFDIAQGCPVDVVKQGDIDGKRCDYILVSDCVVTATR